MSVIQWNSKLLTVTAKVDAVTNPSDIIVWDSAFEHVLVPVQWNSIRPITFRGYYTGAEQGDQWVDAGQWKVRAATGALLSVDNSVYLDILDVVGNTQTLISTLTFTHIDQEFELNVPVGHHRICRFYQTGFYFAATLELSMLSYYDNNGCEPAISYNGDLLSVTYSWTPRIGTVRANAKIYDSAGAIRAVSGGVTLVVVSGAQQGGGS